METYKKPVIVSKHEYQVGALTAAAPVAALVLTKLIGDDDFNPAK